MATLNSYEKAILDKGMSDYLRTVLFSQKGEKITVRLPFTCLINVYESILHIKCSLYSLKPCISRVCKILSEENNSGYTVCWFDDDDNNVITFEVGYTIISFNVGFTKDKNILHFACMPNLTYDFITKSFNIPLCDIFRSGEIFTETRLKALQYEWLFNYTRDFHDIEGILNRCPRVAYETMPANLLKNMEKYSYSRLTSSTLSFCYFANIFGKYTKLLLHDCGVCVTDMKYFDKKFCEDLMKVITLSILEEELGDLKYRVTNFLDYYVNAAKQNISYQLDVNRAIEVNVNNIRTLLDANRYKALETQLHKLNFIHEKVFGDYIVIVPQTQEDKLDEGRQQNNCVGHYYDNSIINGENFIFFLRKKDAPDKSYITCRYNKMYQEVLEARKKNNNPIADVTESKWIEAISKYIKERLE